MACSCAQWQHLPTGQHLPACQEYGNPRGDDTPADSCLFPAGDPLGTLVEQMGSIVDDARQIETDIGTRPYRMWSVVYEWSGGEIGRGEPQVIFEQEFLPTPRITMQTVNENIQSAGYVERGTITVTEISPRYTEDQINWLFRQGAPLSPGQQAFIEISMDGRDGRSDRRRFTVSGVPVRDAENFEWRATLVKQELNRDRFGRATDSATGAAPGTHTPLWAR